MRVADMAACFSSIGLHDFEPGLPAKSLLAIELRNQDQAFGIIYLSNGEGERESTVEDGEALALVMRGRQKLQDLERPRLHFLNFARNLKPRRLALTSR